MPNHVENIITLQGDKRKIREMLEAVQNDDLGIGTIDFNKITGMPNRLNIEAGSRTKRGLEFYKSFIEVYTLLGTINTEKLHSIPVTSEERFLRERRDIPRDEWELGKRAWQNIRDFGAPTWYECYAKLYITLIMISFIKCIVFHNYLLFFKNGKN